MLTLSKIAKLANVSVSTASKAFSMSPEVNSETREMIFNLAKKHGCFKKFFNARYPKLVIAVICPEFESLHYTSQLAKLQIALERRGCEVCVATTQFSSERGRELVDYYSKYARVDGIILLDCAGALSEASRDIPVVCLGHARGDVPRVEIERRNAFCEAIEYFISGGVREIGFIGERLTAARERAFKTIMEEKGLAVNPDFISVGERFADGAYGAVSRLIERGTVPRALICAYDYLAIGAIKCLADNGYRVPEDVLVLGVDNLPEAEFLNPPLSSIDSNIGEACEAVAEKLYAILMGKPYEERTVINATLCLRKSTEV